MLITLEVLITLILRETSIFAPTPKRLKPKNNHIKLSFLLSYLITMSIYIFNKQLQAFKQ